MKRQKYAPYILMIVGILLIISCTDNSKRQKIVISTSLGEIFLELDRTNAPVTAGNFIDLCLLNVYKDAMFYRTVTLQNQPQNRVKIEVIQGGLFHDSIVDKYQVIPHEHTMMTGIKHKDGTISMARNEPGSASTEFFICIGDQPELDYGGKRNPDGEGFSAFGRVAKGMDVVKKIQASDAIDQYIKIPVVIKDIKVLN